VLAIPARIIATCFALFCFAGALILGVLAGHVLLTIMSRALLVLILAYLIGRVIGGVAQYVVDQHVREYKKRNPIPDENMAAENADANSSESLNDAPVERGIT